MNSLSPLEDLRVLELKEDLTETLLLLWLIITIIDKYDYILICENELLGNWIKLEMIYKIIKENVLNTLGIYKNLNSIIIIGIMIYICVSNIIGLLPLTLVLTLDILMNWIISITILCYITRICIRQNKKNSIYIIYVPNIPYLLIIMMGIIECISYISRCISLTIRLSANILGSLVMVKLISCMLWLLLVNLYLILSFNSFTSFIFSIMASVYILELFVCFIQSFIFSLLSSVYLLDTIYLNL